MLLYHMLIFIQYFRFLFDISSVICWTQAKQERDEMGKTAIEEEASSKTTKSYITSHKCNQCSFSSVWEKSLKYHIKIIHTREKLKKCNQCDFSTAKAVNLKTHITCDPDCGWPLCVQLSMAFAIRTLQHACCLSATRAGPIPWH